MRADAAELRVHISARDRAVAMPGRHRARDTAGAQELAEHAGRSRLIVVADIDDAIRSPADFAVSRPALRREGRQRPQQDRDQELVAGDAPCARNARRVSRISRRRCAAARVRCADRRRRESGGRTARRQPAMMPARCANPGQQRQRLAGKQTDKGRRIEFRRRWRRALVPEWRSMIFFSSSAIESPPAMK